MQVKISSPKTDADRIIDMIIFPVGLALNIMLASCCSISGDFGSAAYFSILNLGIIVLWIKSEEILREKQMRKQTNTANIRSTQEE